MDNDADSTPLFGSSPPMGPQADELMSDDASFDEAPRDYHMGDPADVYGSDEEPFHEPPQDPLRELEDEMSEIGSVDERGVISLRLGDFVNLALALRKHKAEFCQLVLTGVLRDRQYQVDPVKDALQDEHVVLAMRDFDSVLGLNKHICVNATLSVYPVAKFSDTLSKNVHIKYSFSNRRGNHANIPVHKIPNFCLGKWGTHNLLRVVIPALYDKERKSPFLSQDQLSTFYDKGLLPAIHELMPQSSSEWPTSYAAEMTRARGKNGKLAFQTKQVAKWFVESLGDLIRTLLSNNNVRWAEGLVFLHQIRGVKGSSGHKPTHEAAQLSLDEFLEEQRITPDRRVDGQWWVDVGLEIASQDKKCLVWRTDSHYHVVKEVLRISAAKADRITSLNSSKYVRDLTSHLTSVSGCRISPGVLAQGPHEAAYLQMYTTDKALTYRPDGYHFGKFMTGQDIIKHKWDDYTRSLYNIYREASEHKNFSLARVEVRVPLSEAAEVMTDVNIAVIRNALVTMESVVWWSLRAYRILAFNYVLELQTLGDPIYRAVDSALLLTAAAPWFINGIHSTPDNGPASRDLMGKILPLVMRTNADAGTLLYPISTRPRTVTAQNHGQVEEQGEGNEDDDFEGDEPVIADHEPEDNISVASDVSEHQRERQLNQQEMLPHAPYGIVFLRRIRIGEGINMPRFLDTTVPMISLKTFQHVFGIRRDNATSEFFRAKLIVKFHPTRVGNRVRHTAARAPDPSEAPIFHLADRGHALEPIVADTGSDFGDLHDEIQEAPGDADANIDIALTTLWKQFFVDLALKAPNRQRAAARSYCVLSPDERLDVTEDTFNDMRLSAFFNDVQYRVGTPVLWDSAFDKFWPEITVVVKGTQNFPSMRYFIEWCTLVNRLVAADKEDTVVEMREELRKRFFTLGWIPHPDTSHVWYTKPGSPLYKKYPGTELGAAPRVLIHWDRTATF